MAILVAAFGLAIGSFLNVVIYRLRTEEKGWRKRSQCPHCHVILRAIDLVPLLSFVALRGRCRSCRKPISCQYPLVEGAVAALFVAAFYAHGATDGLLAGQGVALARDLFFIAVLTVVFVIDLRDMVVHDSVTIPAAVIALAFNLALGRSLANLLLAAAIGAGFFFLQWTISRGRWVGGGDIRIGAMMGAMLGFPGVVEALLLAYIVGAVAAVGLLLSRKTTWSSRMAFGTFLSFATVVILLYGDPLLHWYTHLL